MTQLLESAIGFPGLGFEINPSSGFSIGGFEIKWYGVIIAFAALLAALYVLRRSKSFGITEDEVLNVTILALPCGILGARLYYVLFEWDRFFGPNNNWYDFINIRDGGMAIYGGVIGAFLAIVLYLCCSKKRRPTLLPICDLAAFALLIGQCLGRWGNFFNREAHGGITSENFFLRMRIFEGGEWICVHPTFLYESVWNAIGFCILHFASKKRKYDGQVLLWYIAWYGFGRAWIESMRTDSLMVGPLRVSQWLAGISCVTALALLICFRFVLKPDPAKRYVDRLAAAKATPAPREEDDLSESELEEDAEPENETETELEPDDEEEL